MTWTLVEKKPDPPGGAYQVTMSDTGRKDALPAHTCAVPSSSDVEPDLAMVYTDGKKEYVACPWCDRVWVRS
jgi:hypothetical protein